MAESLDAPSLAAALPSGSWHVEVVVETSSTNLDLRSAAVAGTALPGRVLVAEHQRAGRGRLGRRWESAPGAGLTFSVLLSLEEAPTDRWGWLPLLSGLAVAEAVEAVAGVPLRVKWPNDVLCAADRKVCGVLAERVEVAGGPVAGQRASGGQSPRSLVIVGIGLNVTAGPEELPVPTAGSLAMAGARCTDRPALFGAVVSGLAVRLSEWLAHGGDAAAAGLLDAYAARSATLGREVSVMLPGGETVAGRAERIDATGALVLRVVSGELAVTAGDITAQG